MFDLVTKLVDFIVHIDRHLAEIIAEYGLWTYGVLFLIIFAETGLVITPFLPGDSLLFTAGAFCAKAETGLNVHLMAALLFVAAVLGDTINYWLGARIGPAVFKRDESIFLRKKHLEQTHAFFEKYGGRAVILARFVPIARTFIPCVAGGGRMTYLRFLVYNIVGGFAWSYALTYAGYWFGNRPFVQQNFEAVIITIIIISVLPIVWGTWRVWEGSRRQRTSLP